MDSQLLMQHRMQKVVVGSRSSPSFFCIKGVLQRSVLSPLLFNIFVSDLHSLAKENNSSLRSCADDMALYYSDTSAEHASKTVCTNDELVDLGSLLTTRNLLLYTFVRLPRKAIIYQVHLPSYSAELQ